MLEDQGFSTGLAAEGRKADNPFGTRENPELVRLDKEVLELNGCDWDRPPNELEVRYTAHYLRLRDQLTARLAARPAVLKDPRMVLLREFWQASPLKPIGVIRNPVAVTDSLQRREPERTADECQAMWRAYNSHLLDWLESTPFPVIEFGGDSDLAEELERSLAYYGFPSAKSFRFFDRELVRAAGVGRGWRRQVPADLSSLWDEIIARSRP